VSDQEKGKGPNCVAINKGQGKKKKGESILPIQLQGRGRKEREWYREISDYFRQLGEKGGGKRGLPPWDISYLKEKKGGKGARFPYFCWAKGERGRGGKGENNGIL